MKKNLLTQPLVVSLLASLCCLLWGSVVPFLNLGYAAFSIESGETSSLILFAGVRFFFAGVLTILFASMMQRRLVRPKPGNWHLALKLSLVQTVVQYVFFYIGVANTQSVKASIIQGLIAFVNILVACYLFRSERMNHLKWIGGLLGVSGVVLVNLGGGGVSASMSLMGEGALFGSMFVNAISAGMIKIYGQKDSSVTLSGWQFVFGGAIMAVVGFAMGGRLEGVSAMGVAILLYLGMVSAVAYTLWAVLLSLNPVSSVAVFTFLQPIFGVALGMLLVPPAGDVPFLRYGAALVLVCLSIVIVGRGQQLDQKNA